MLKQNLDSSGTIVQKRNNGDNIIIIPIKKAYLASKNIDRNYIPNLLIVQKNSGSIKWGSIVYFIRSDGKTQDALLPSTLQKIINNEQIEDNGVFNFFSLTDKLLYRLEYKNKKLYSWGRQVQKGNTGKTETTNGTIKVNSTCINWYLTTTYYYSDGSTTETVEYIGTTCYGDDGGGGGGTGGGGGSAPEQGLDPYDQLILKDVTVSKEETAYGEEDLAVDPNSLGGQAFYSRIQYEYRAHILCNAESGVVQSVNMDDPLVFPVNESYELPSGYLTTRNLLMQPGGKGWNNPSPGIVYLSWSATVLARYSTGGNSITKTYNASVTDAPVHVP